MEIDKTMTYKVFTKMQGIFGIVIGILVGLGFAASVLLEYENGTWTPDMVIMSGVSLGMVGLIAMTIRKMKSGLHTIKIESNMVALIYPDDMLQFGESQIFDLKTRRYRHKGKKKGRVSFEGSDGKKYLFSIRRYYPGGEEVFTWFEKIEEKRKQQNV